MKQPMLNRVTAGWPASLSEEAVPELAVKVLETVPTTFLTVAAAMTGIHWVIKRRQKLAAHPEEAEPVTEPSDNEESA